MTEPAGAGLDAFRWRLSAARVAWDGPFSAFPGIDRSLAVLSGEGLELEVAGTATRLGPGDEPLCFPGDRPTVARLLGGAVEDLNIMTRRGLARHRMRRVSVDGPVRFAPAASTLLLFCVEGQVGVDGGRLEPRDTALVAEAGRQDVTVDGRGTLYAIEIEDAR